MIGIWFDLIMIWLGFYLEKLIKKYKNKFYFFVYPTELYFDFNHAHVFRMENKQLINIFPKFSSQVMW